LPSQYTNYANYLNGFAAFMTSNAAPLKVISVQNEPDANVTYDSCSWTPTQLQTFFQGPAALITNSPVMMPESEGYNFAYSDPTLNDSVAVKNVKFIGGHLYGVNTIVDYPNAHNKGKPTWMTEFLINDQTIGSALETAKQIHDCLTVGNMSAYIWWKAYGDANGLVNASGVPQYRGFVLAQWSWFVRPNDFRIGATNTGLPLVTSLTFVSAYKNTNSGQFAIVAINTNSIPIPQTFALKNFPLVAPVTPWISSSNSSLAMQPAMTVTNASFAYTLPPASVVTFAGRPVSRPLFTSISRKASAISLTISGDPGPNYTLQASTNLMNWQVMLVTNPPALPFSVTDTNLSNAHRFYRVQLGP
jgi:glucuronoarabinoxylan endo-1,4-beta-xylanase